MSCYLVAAIAAVALAVRMAAEATVAVAARVALEATAEEAVEKEEAAAYSTRTGEDGGPPQTPME